MLRLVQVTVICYIILLHLLRYINLLKNNLQDVGARSADFGHKSGTYSVDLIVGDSSLTNSFKWTIGEVSLKFQSEGKKGKIFIKNM